MRDEFILLSIGLVILAVVVLAPKEAPTVINNQPAQQSGGGSGGLAGLTSILSVFGF